MKSDPPSAPAAKQGDSKRRRDWILAIALVIGLGVIAPIAISRFGPEPAAPPEPRAADGLAPRAERPDGVIAVVSGANPEIGWKALKAATGPAIPRLPYELPEALVRFGGISSAATQLLDKEKPFAALIGIHGKTPYVVAGFRLRDRSKFDQEVFEGPLAMFEPVEHSKLALTVLQPRVEMLAHVARSGDWLLVATERAPLLSAGPFVAQTLAPKLTTRNALDFRADRRAVRAYGPLLVARTKRTSAKDSATGIVAESLWAPIISVVQRIMRSGEGATLTLNLRGDTVLAQGKLRVAKGSEGDTTLTKMTVGSMTPLLRMPGGSTAKAVWYMQPERDGDGQIWAKAFARHFGVPTQRMSRLGTALASVLGARGASNACAFYRVPKAILRCRFDNAQVASFEKAMMDAARALEVPPGDAGVPFGKVELREKIRVLSLRRSETIDDFLEVAWRREGEGVELVVASKDAHQAIVTKARRSERRLISFAAANPAVLAAIATWPHDHLKLGAAKAAPSMTIALVRAPDGVAFELESSRDALWPALEVFRE